MTTTSENLPIIRIHAGQVAERAAAAYWVQSHSDFTFEFLKAQMHEEFLEIAKAMGYKVERLSETDQDAD